MPCLQGGVGSALSAVFSEICRCFCKDEFYCSHGWNLKRCPSDKSEVCHGPMSTFTLVWTSAGLDLQGCTCGRVIVHIARPSAYIYISPRTCCSSKNVHQWRNDAARNANQQEDAVLRTATKNGQNVVHVADANAFSTFHTN